MLNQLLFICTGNYYRSRFAEALFNHAAQQNNLDWHAESRGLATWMVDQVRDGMIASCVLHTLTKQKISHEMTSPRPKQLTLVDLQQADRIIALKEVEHRPMMLKQFPEWADRIEYWHVHDIDFSPPEAALPEIASLVATLVSELRSAETKSLSAT